MARSFDFLHKATRRTSSWGQPLVRQGMMTSAAVHLLAGALLWASGWWLRGTMSEPVTPYPPEQDFASVSVPPAAAAEPESQPQTALEWAPQLQSPETRPLEPAEISLPRTPQQPLLPSGDLVTHNSPADQLGAEGAPQLDRPQAGSSSQRAQRDELPEVGFATGSLARARSGVDSRLIPRTLVNPPPEYPRDALIRRLEGVVLLQVAVDAAGGVADIRLVRSSGTTSLDEAALAAVRQWRFLPARDPDTPLRRVNIPIEFVIRDR